MPRLPPRGADGRVVEHDHEDILDQDDIVRRVDPKHHVVPDPKSATGFRISSMFLKQTGGVSVDLLRPMLEDGVDCVEFITTPRFVGSVKFKARTLRSGGFKIGYDPVPANDPAGPENPYHGLLWGRISSSKFKEVMQQASWLVPIHHVSF